MCIRDRNITFIETNSEIIVFDCSMSEQAGEFALQEIRKISDKPITTLFYSHHHPDHYRGAGGLVNPEEVKAGKVKIYAWANFLEEKENELGLIVNRQTMGALYFTGALLDKEDKAYLSCCGTKTFGGKDVYIPPTDILDKDTQLTIDGLPINIFYSGGEAISEFGIHLPAYDMVFIADEFFYSFPNLHSIRGSKPRIPDNYIKALDKIRELQPEWLIGAHIMPIQGKAHIQEIITTNRDAIQYLWDQSIRYINKGYTAVELQHQFKELPAHLQLKPFNAPMYGSPITAVPEFYTGWVSWFQGDATDLFPEHPVAEAKKMVSLLGGRDKVLKAAEAAFDKEDAQFGAKLSQYLVRINKEDQQARYLKAACLKKLGYAQTNQIMRSWYLMGAKELEGKIDAKKVLQFGKSAVAGSVLSSEQIFNSWRYLLDAEKAGTKKLKLQLSFTDTKEDWTLELRNSILEMKKGRTNNPETLIKTTVAQINTFNQGGDIAANFQVEKGSLRVLAELIGYLDRETPGIYMHLR